MRRARASRAWTACIATNAFVQPWIFFWACLPLGIFSWLCRFWCCHGCMGWVATLAPPSMAAPRVTVTDVLVLLFYGLFISMVSVFVAGPKLLPVKYFLPTIFDLTHNYCIG